MKPGVFIALIAISLLSMAPSGRRLAAEEIQLGVAPSNPVKAGFTMFVFSERLGNEGFQPLTLRFRAIGQSFNRQRVLRIQFRPRTQYRTEIDFQFSCDVTVPEGVKQHDVSILVPHFYRWETCSVRLYEDGRRLGRLPTSLSIPPTVKDWGQQMSIGVMVPRDAATSGEPWAAFPDLRSIVTVQGNGPITTKPDVTRLGSSAARSFAETIQSGWARFRILEEDSMESSWLGYSQLDLIIAPYPVLERLEREQPGKLVAIREWVSTGGQIWAFAAGGRQPDEGSFFSGKEDNLNRQIKFYADVRPRLMLGESNDTAPIQYQPYNYGSYYSSAYSYGGSEISRREVYQNLVSKKNPMVATKTRKQLTAGLAVMSYGIGRVVFLEDDDPFPGSFQLWKSLETDRQGWNERNGVDYSAGSDSYWAWLMPSVGQPPVTAFVILNGLFVLIMGPILYFTLRRRGRLYLLYFLAPTLAFLATMGLFTYAFLSDGFVNRARVRQLTWYDGRHLVPGQKDSARSRQVSPAQTGELPESGAIGNAVQEYAVLDQSRQTYYTVVDSQQGLAFSESDFVLPIHHAELINNYSYYPADDSRAGDYLIRQTADGWKYEGSFLPTRTQVHYLVTRPGSDRLPIETEVVDGKFMVTNRLETPLSQVSVRDGNGKYWWTDQSIAPGQRGELQSVRTNPFSELVMDLVDPDTTGMPTPYQSRVSFNDRSAAEEQFIDLAGKPTPNSFMAITDVDTRRFALRECVQDECKRLIGGQLP